MDQLCVVKLLCLLIGLLQTCVALCPRDYICDVESLSIACEGYSLSNATQMIPENTISFKYTAKEEQVDVAAANFSHLTQLEKLQIVPYNCIWNEHERNSRIWKGYI